METPEKKAGPLRRSDPEVKNLQWRTRKNGTVVPIWRQRVNGVAQSIKLPAIAPENKGDLRKLIKQQMRAKCWDEMLRKFGLEKQPEAPPCVTFGKLFETYRKWSAGQRFAPNTVENNIKAMSRLIRWVKGEEFDVEAASVDIFTVKFLGDFESAMVGERRGRAKAEGWDAERTEREVASASRSVYATIHAARSLFKGKALDSTDYAALLLPDLGRALKASFGLNTLKKEWWMPDLAVVRRIIEDSAALRKEDPAAWLGMQLEVLCGTRRGSVLDAKWSWFVEGISAIPATNSKPWESGKAGNPDSKDAAPQKAMFLEVRRAKGAPSKVQLSQEDWEALLRARADVGAALYPKMEPEERNKLMAEGFVLPHTDRKERERIMAERLVPWLRARGLTQANGRRLPNHELRKIWSTLMDRTHGHDNLMIAAAWSAERLKWAYTERPSAVGMAGSEWRAV